MTRKQLVSYLDENYFDEIILGALVRVSYENKYRVCKIVKSIDTTSEYIVDNPMKVVGNQKVPMQPVYTKKELLCKWG